MEIKAFTLGYMGVNTYIIFDKEQGKAAVFDAPAESKKILDFLTDNNLELEYIFLTHGHFDHVAYLPFFSEKYPTAKIFIHPKDSFYIEKNGWNFHEEDFLDIGLSFWVENVQNLGFDFPSSHEDLDEGNVIFGWKVLHTPGHTPGSICLYNEEEKVLIAGDTLFDGGFGRTDLRGGSMSEMTKSLARLETLPSGIRVYSGHGGSFIR